MTQFGALFPPEALEHVAKLEDWGYSSVWASEHIVFYGPHLEALPVLAAFAARTTTLRLGTSVYLLPLRHATITAKSVATVDVISGGRVILGIGVGGEYPKEFESVGVPVKERGARTNEAIPLLRRLWSEEHVTHEGRFYPLDDVTLLPLPPQGASLPIWVAGRSDAAIERAGVMGDAFMPYLYTAQRFREGLEKARSFAQAAGRDPMAVGGVIYQFISMGSNYDTALQTAIKALTVTYNQPFDSIAAKYCAVGTPADCAERINEFVEAGAGHVILVPVGEGDHVEKFQAFSEEIFPKLG